MKAMRKAMIMLFSGIVAMPMMAQKTMDDMQYLTINENVTTVITASEPVRFVDISTDKVAGDQPITNTTISSLGYTMTAMYWLLSRLLRNATVPSTLLSIPLVWTKP